MPLVRASLFTLSLFVCLHAAGGSFDHVYLPRVTAIQAHDITVAGSEAWVIGYNSGTISRVTLDGVITTFPTAGQLLQQIVFDPQDSTLWGMGQSALYQYSTSGDLLKEFYLPTPGYYQTNEMILGPDGALWITFDYNYLVRVTKSGDATIITDSDPSFDAYRLTAGPDGNVWVSGHYSHDIARVTPAGVLTKFPLGIEHYPNSITAGPDGNLWFSSNYGVLRKVTPSGVISQVRDYAATDQLVTGSDGRLWATRWNFGASSLTKYNTATNAVEATYALPSDAETVQQLVAGDAGVWWVGGTSFGHVSYTGEIKTFPFKALGPDVTAMTSTATDLWWVADDENLVGRTAIPSGVTTLYPLPNPDSKPVDIVAALGFVWIAEANRDRITRINDSGAMTEFTIPSVGARPTSLVYGPDGNFWITLAGLDKVARMTPQGVFTEYPLPGLGRYPNSVAFGADGNLWFTERDSGNVARRTSDGTVTEFPAFGTNPRALVPGPDGHLWYATNRETFRISTTGEVSPVVDWTPSVDQVLGPDGAVWGNEPNALSRIAADGSRQQWRPRDRFVGSAVTVGPDGKIWASERTGNLIRVTQDQPLQVTPQRVCRGANGWFTGVFATFLDPNGSGTLTDYQVRVVWGGEFGSTNLTLAGDTYQLNAQFYADSAPTTARATITTKPGSGNIGQTASVDVPMGVITATSQTVLFKAEGGEGSISVSDPSGCPWTATSDVPWITFPSTPSGSASGPLHFQVQPYPGGTGPRFGRIRIDRTTIDVKQDHTSIGASGLYVLTPCRLFDTRESSAISASATWEYKPNGHCGVPVDATAVIMNVTAVSPVGDGWLAFYEAGARWPGISTVGLRKGSTRATGSIVKLSNGAFSILNGTKFPVHFIVDVTGFFR